ncbi:MAG: FxsA family protein [SAR324 cluster bacterium]|nr:FxsA family protein [SAR324 cluster bacterium]
MGYLLLLIFLVLPFVEIWILFQLSETLPFFSLVFICITTGGLGLWLMNIEGFSLWTFFESELQNQRMPTEELLEAILTLFSGITLLIPGLITDAIGFSLLVPICREWIISNVKLFIQKKLSQQ